jgi:hypothetical protein
MSLAGVVGRWAGQGSVRSRVVVKLCLAVVSRFDVRSMTNVAKRFYQIWSSLCFVWAFWKKCFCWKSKHNPIDGQTGGTARPGTSPTWARHDRPEHDRPVYIIGPCRAARRAQPQAQARHGRLLTVPCRPDSPKHVRARAGPRARKTQYRTAATSNTYICSSDQS